MKFPKVLDIIPAKLSDRTGKIGWIEHAKDNSQVLQFPHSPNINSSKIWLIRWGSFKFDKEQYNFNESLKLLILFGISTGTSTLDKE